MIHTPSKNRSIVAGILVDAAIEGISLTYNALAANVEARDGPYYSMQALAKTLPYVDAVARDLGAPPPGILVTRENGQMSPHLLAKMGLEEEDLEELRAEVFAYPWAGVRDRMTDPEAFEMHQSTLIQLRVPRELAPAMREWAEVVRGLPRDKAVDVLARCLRVAGS